MKWIVKGNDAWQVEVELRDPELLDDLKWAASGILEPMGVPLIVDPESELKEVIERELLDVLCKKYYGMDLLSLFEGVIC